MSRVVRLTPIESIKPGTPPSIAPDGTILNPEPYHAADVEFDDGISVQIERPLTAAKLKAAYAAAEATVKAPVDGVSVGDFV